MVSGEWCVVNGGFEFGAILGKTFVRGVDLDLTIKYHVLIQY